MTKTKKMLLIFVPVLFIAVIIGVAYYFSQTQQQQQKTAVKQEAAAWKLYNNSKNEYSIQYPENWVAREFPDTQTGAAFRPSDKPNDYQYEYISINKMNKVRGPGEKPVPLEEYVKTAYNEIQNYTAPTSITKFVTNSGVGYTATYTNGLPRTYFDVPKDPNATIQMALDDKAYLETYNEMTKTFAVTESVTPKISKVADPNVKTYTSDRLGIAFTYLEKQNGQTISVFEDSNKICVTYDNKDVNCEKGQFIELFGKSKSETTEAAIRRIFLMGKDPAKCLVTPYKIKNYPASYVAAEISYPKEGDFDMEKMSAANEYCSQKYAQANGVRYFLENKASPTKLLFVSIGQYGIISSENIPWQETIEIK